jgi:hypothetical protein
MTVRDTSLLALAEIAEKLGPDESAVLMVLDEIGPASDKRILEALNQKEQVTSERQDYAAMMVVGINPTVVR